MKLSKGLGYAYLSKPERYAYKIMLHAFSAMEASFNISGIDRKVNLMQVMTAVLGDNPTIIYFDRTSFELDDSISGKRHMHLKGVIPKSQAAEMIMELERISNQIISSLDSKGDAYTTLISLYNYLQKSVQYDKATFQANTKGIRQNPTSHNAYGALINQMAVCDGFSAAFSLLAQKLGYPCMLASGKSSYNSHNTLVHGWNVIEVQNKYYHMDVTWDAREYTQTGEYSYLYFALNDDDIGTDHDWCRESTPVCTYRDLSYYVKNGFYANSMEQAKLIIKTASIRKHNTSEFQIKLSYHNSLPENTGEILAQAIADEFAKAGKAIRLSYEWNERKRYFLAKMT